jgi:peptidoglycan/LPS O-acetylase OafA/YrhL
METLTPNSPTVLSQTPRRTPELLSLTGARFFAAIYVVFYHFLVSNLSISFLPLRNVLSAGHCAVGFFFVLSGFVLTYSYVPSGPHSIKLLSFWKARFSRIYPAYFLAFLLAAPFQIAGSIRVNGLTIAIEKLSAGAVLYLTLLQSWTPWTAWYWNIPAWSLSVEVFFYFCFPFAALRLCKVPPRTCLKLAGVIWLLGLAAPALYCAFWPVASHTPLPLGQVALETNPIMRLPEFLAGMLIGRIFVSGFRLTPRLASWLSVVALASLVLALSFSSAVPRLLFSNGLLTPFFALLIFTLAHQSGLLAKFLSHPALKVLGEASYAIYILQYPVSYLCQLDHNKFSILRFSVYLLALIVLSVFTFFFIEQPLRRRLRSLGSAKKQTSNARSPEAPLTHQVTAEA